MKIGKTPNPALLFVSGVLISAVLAACCSDGKLPDIVAAAIQQPPVAALVARPARAVVDISEITGLTPFEVNLDATDSFDPDGEIVQYDWDFESDGNFDLIDAASIVPHTYTPDTTVNPGNTVSATEVPVGTYTATVRVFDNDGLSATATAIINVNDLEFIPPTAVGSAMADSSDPLLVHYDGTASFDIDGTVEQYDWDMDNDSTFELIDVGPTPDHTFPNFGTHTVGLQVTDDDELTDQTTIDVTLTEEPNIPPVANVVPDPAFGNAPGLSVLFDAAASFDTDGVIVRYDWDMNNDGTFEITDGGVTQSATYDAGGVYTVGVQVTDDDGATDQTTAEVTVLEIFAPVANVAAIPPSGTLMPGSPSPEFSGNYDASASFDTDGTIVRYDWDMDNDGTFELTNGGDTQPFTYNTGGIFTVGVKVTDNDGLTDTDTASVDVNEPPVAAVSPDPAFGHSPVFVEFNASASFDNDGTIVKYDWDMDNDGTFEILDGGVTQNSSYDTTGFKTVGVRVTDDDGATDTAITTMEVNMPPVAAVSPEPAFGDAPLDVLFDASASFDSDGTIVQYDWDMDNDGTFELINTGVTSAASYPTGGFYTVGVRVTDDDGARDTATTAVDVNNPPVALVTASTPVWNGSAWDVTFDGSGSTDSDGFIARYDWDMDNDGTFEIIAGGITQMAAYSVDTTYTVGLRVTDDDDAQDTDTVDVVILTPPIAILTGTDIGDACIEWDASASFDPNGTIVSWDWDMDNNGTFETNSSDMEFDCYQGSGTYTVGVQVTDNDGLMDTAYFSVTIP